MLTITQLTREHVLAASEFIRPEDRREWIAGCGCDVEDSLLSPDGLSGYSRAALDEEGNVLCLWGANRGWVWLAATSFGQAQWRSLIRLQDELVGELRDAFPGIDLECYADDRNALHHVWLKRLGFTPKDHLFLGPWQLPFTQYELKGQA